jgi:hypothetical protein
VLKVDSIARDFNLILLAKCISDDAKVAGCSWSLYILVVSPRLWSPSIRLVLVNPSGHGHDSVADSLSTLLYHNFNNKGSRERRLAELILRICVYIDLYRNVLLFTS